MNNVCLERAILQSNLPAQYIDVHNLMVAGSH